jgi:uncharacterized protein (TIGR02466 family)
MNDIVPLFPQPLAVYTVDPEPWQNDLRRVPIVRREFHWYSQSSTVLNDYTDLHTELSQRVDQFAEEYGLAEKLDITISWINENRRGDSTHQHQHPNSIFSGCWYWDVVGTTEIHFHRQPTGSLPTWCMKLDERQTQWTTDTTVIRVSQGDLLIWPSYLQHSVPAHLGPGTRRTLAFNTMPRTPWGSDLYAVPSLRG